MKAGKSEDILTKCKVLAGDSVECYKILMDLYDTNRRDVLLTLMKTMMNKENPITPEQIVETYRSCGGRAGFLKRCDKFFNKRSLRRERNEENYKYNLLQYYCGERISHPDGTRFEDGKEINYD